MSGLGNRLHASAYLATKRSVFFSPPPPIMIGAGGQVAERRVGLEHLALGRPDPADLEEVVHYRDELETALVRGAGDHGQVRAEPRRAIRRGEVRDLQANLHKRYLPGLPSHDVP